MRRSKPTSSSEPGTHRPAADLDVEFRHPGFAPLSRSAYRAVFAGAALIAPALLWGQSGDPGERQDGQGSAPAPTFAVRGPAPPDLPEMVRRDEAGGATMRATRLTEPFELDGRLDDAIYDRVPGVGGFIQALPLEGEPATEPTDVWVFYDDEAVYIAGRCWDSQPHRMVATEMRRDNFGIFNNENLAVILDTFYDRRNAFFFYMNPIGGFFDGLIADENPPNRDWTAVWDSRAARFENGWTMEMRIPFKTLRYASGGPQVWGINFRRIVRWKNELSFLTRVPAALGPRAITKISSAGTLVGLEAPTSSRTVEVKPYLIGDAAGIRADAGGLERDYGGDFGVDAKVGITSGLIADLTWNTDFAQVEADTQQINLTRAEDGTARGRRRLRSRHRVPAPPGLPAQLCRGALQPPAAFDLLAAPDRLDRQHRLHHRQRGGPRDPDPPTSNGGRTRKRGPAERGRRPEPRGSQRRVRPGR